MNDGVLPRIAEDGYAEVIHEILVAGANVHVDDEAALRSAASSGHEAVVRLLLAAGADPVVVWSKVVSIGSCPHGRNVVHLRRRHDPATMRPVGRLFEAIDELARLDTINTSVPSTAALIMAHDRSIRHGHGLVHMVWRGQSDTVGGRSGVRISGADAGGDSTLQLRRAT